MDGVFYVFCKCFYGGSSDDENNVIGICLGLSVGCVEKVEEWINGYVPEDRSENRALNTPQWCVFVSCAPGVGDRGRSIAQVAVYEI